MAAKFAQAAIKAELEERIRMKGPEYKVLEPAVALGHLDAIEQYKAE